MIQIDYIGVCGCIVNAALSFFPKEERGSWVQVLVLLSYNQSGMAVIHSKLLFLPRKHEDGDVSEQCPPRPGMAISCSICGVCG